MRAQVWGPYCTLGLESDYVHVVYPPAHALIQDDDGTIRDATDEELDLIGQRMDEALAASFVIDSTPAK